MIFTFINNSIPLVWCIYPHRFVSFHQTAAHFLLGGSIPMEFSNRLIAVAPTRRGGRDTHYILDQIWISGGITIELSIC